GGLGGSAVGDVDFGEVDVQAVVPFGQRAADDVAARDPQRDLGDRHPTTDDGRGRHDQPLERPERAAGVFPHVDGAGVEGDGGDEVDDDAVDLRALDAVGICAAEDRPVCAVDDDVPDPGRRD